jgi:hypothetical protein
MACFINIYQVIYNNFDFGYLRLQPEASWFHNTNGAGIGCNILSNQTRFMEIYDNWRQLIRCFVFDI